MALFSLANLKRRQKIKKSALIALFFCAFFIGYFFEAIGTLEADLKSVFKSGIGDIDAVMFIRIDRLKLHIEQRGKFERWIEIWGRWIER